MTRARPTAPLDRYVVLCRRQPWSYVDDLVAQGIPAGAQLRWLAADCPHDEAVRALAEADILMGAWVRGWSFTQADFAAAPRLRLVQLMSAGFDGLDLTAPTGEGVAVANIGDANASTVAEHAVMLILALLRQLPRQAGLVRDGGWRPAPEISELRGKTVGLVGMGAIAVEVVRRLQPFGVELHYHARRRLEPDREASLGLTYRTLPDLLAGAHIVSLHTALTEQTRHLIGAAELALMRGSAVLINTGRGGLVDEQALTEALAAGRLRGAAVDVLEVEPPAPGNALLRLENVIVTPHQAGLSPDAWPRIVAACWGNVERAARGHAIRHRVPRSS